MAKMLEESHIADIYKLFDSKSDTSSSAPELTGESIIISKSPGQLISRARKRKLAGNEINLFLTKNFQNVFQKLFLVIGFWWIFTKNVGLKNRKGYKGIYFKKKLNALGQNTTIF